MRLLSDYLYSLSEFARRLPGLSQAQSEAPAPAARRARDSRTRSVDRTWLSNEIFSAPAAARPPVRPPAAVSQAAVPRRSNIWIDYWVGPETGDRGQYAAPDEPMLCSAMRKAAQMRDMH